MNIMGAQKMFAEWRLINKELILWLGDLSNLKSPTKDINIQLHLGTTLPPAPPHPPHLLPQASSICRCKMKDLELRMIFFYTFSCSFCLLSFFKYWMTFIKWNLRSPMYNTNKVRASLKWEVGFEPSNLISIFPSLRSMKFDGFWSPSHL